MSVSFFQRAAVSAFCGALFSGGASLAQEAAPEASNATAAIDDCPSPVSIYFASRETGASPESEAVLNKVHQAAGECAADQIDIVAHVDAGEGDHALGLALERLSFVADHLVSLGVPAERIRVATEIPDAAERGSVGQRQIDIAVSKFTPPQSPTERKDDDEPRVILLAPRNLI